MELLLENLELNRCFFSSAHISNYIHIKGSLPEERLQLLEEIRRLRERFTPPE